MAPTFATLIIDMQERYLRGVSCRERLVQNQLAVIRHCVEAHIPLVSVTNYSATALLPEIRDATQGATRFREYVKPNMDAFETEGLAQQLAFWGVDAVLLMGVNASECVKQTARGAKGRFHVHTAIDLIADQDDADHQSTWYLGREYRIFASYEQAIANMPPQITSRPSWPEHPLAANP